VVENPLYLPDAIKRLRESMLDPVLTIDLEWRPTFGPAQSTPVALIQIASARLALLVRTCRMQYRLAPELLALLQDPKVALVGFAWDGADEGKMQSTFSVGAASFGRFFDLQAVARALGWHGYGLARLTAAVLGTPLPKSRRVTMSNWETRALTRAQVRWAGAPGSALKWGWGGAGPRASAPAVARTVQGTCPFAPQSQVAAAVLSFTPYSPYHLPRCRTQVKYAALDVLVAGQVFRGLRLWHRSPSPCARCLQPLGAVQAQPALQCGAPECGKAFGANVAAYLAHCRNTGHAAVFSECVVCGCLRTLRPEVVEAISGIGSEGELPKRPLPKAAE
jgi:hypothetical protein